MPVVAHTQLIVENEHVELARDFRVTRYLEHFVLLLCRFQYREFDELFKFNSELMNPNNKDNRYSYVIQVIIFYKLFDIFWISHKMNDFCVQKLNNYVQFSIHCCFCFVFYFFCY